MREFDPPLPDGRRYCGNYGCGQEATTVFKVTGIVPLAMRSCDDCRRYFSRDSVSAILLVEEIDEGQALALEVMEDIEFRQNWSRKSLGPA